MFLGLVDKLKFFVSKCETQSS